MRLADLQQQLQAAILDPAHDTIDARLRIHHGHFWTRMREHFALRHPLLARFLGDHEVVEVVRRYFVAHPPRSCISSEVAAGIARFLATTEPWCDSPILAELAAYDFQRTGAAANAEEATLSELSADERATVTLRLKKRVALLITHYRFHAVPLAQLSRHAPLDEQPTYLLVHATPRRIVAEEIDHRVYRALEQLAIGGTVQALTEALRRLELDEPAIEALFARCLDAELLVAVGAS